MNQAKTLANAARTVLALRVPPASAEQHRALQGLLEALTAYEQAHAQMAVFPSRLSDSELERIAKEEARRLIAENPAARDRAEDVLQTFEIATAGMRRIANYAAHLRALLIGLATNPHVDLADLIYAVREREGLGWDGPAVKAWGDAVAGIMAELKLRPITSAERARA